jgi:hypothetical protein
LCNGKIVKLKFIIFRTQVENFLKNYQNFGDNFVLPGSALQLDSGEDEKMTLWRIVILDHKKEEFMNQIRNAMRVYCKLYDENEIINLPKEFKEREQIKVSIEEKKQTLIQNCSAGYSEVYQALLHLKVHL